MESRVSWLVKGTVLNGADTALYLLMNDMVDSTHAEEPGTVCYQWFLHDETRECHILESYVNAEAAARHLETFEKQFAARFQALIRIDSLTVYGEPGDKVTDALRGPGTVFLSSYGGFTR